MTHRDEVDYNFGLPLPLFIRAWYRSLISRLSILPDGVLGICVRVLD